MSEGISFNDEFARGVVCVGLPLPNFGEPEIKHKREYNDRMRSLAEKLVKDPNSPPKATLLPGSAWYNQQAFRAVNQALGRCSRHKDDYGVIALVDSRWPRETHGLAEWVKEFIRADTSVPRVCRAISELFAEQGKQTSPAPAPVKPESEPPTTSDAQTVDLSDDDVIVDDPMQDDDSEVLVCDSATKSESVILDGVIDDEEFWSQPELNC
eukprot:c1246_g2_i1.p1 GENE.c1246_g2_i1~~c1246_g2_i1.p1  ORF type:complete len:211 (-),score=45.10 c1246_g2_i1:201-833(-)